MEEMHRAKDGGGAGSFHALQKCHSFPEFPFVHQPQKSSNPIIWGVYGGFITEAWLIKSLAIGDRIGSLAPFLYLVVRRDGADWLPLATSLHP